MRISYAFSCLPVTHRDAAAQWYKELFGRPPAFLPNDNEAVWQVADTASVYVLVDQARAGRGIVTLIVDDLESTLEEMSGRGIVPGQIKRVGDAGRKSTLQDPDGNEISFVELA